MLFVFICYQNVVVIIVLVKMAAVSQSLLVTAHVHHPSPAKAAQVMLHFVLPIHVRATNLLYYYYY